ncbi:uncharacterized protein V1518DRAFT_425776 [Limtongia smithiae]|uniref:uncharacterized protein n=1 Tax=Limtongia smithiae TaxID=1125753 RepID=UPI0034CECBE7
MAGRPHSVMDQDPPIFKLPPELLIDILLWASFMPGHQQHSRAESRPFFAADPPPVGSAVDCSSTQSPESCLAQIYRCARVCKSFYALIFHPAQDVRIWRSIALEFGYDPKLLLRNVVRCGDTSMTILSGRSWHSAVQVAAAWDRPFLPPSFTVGGGSRRKATVKEVKSYSKSLPNLQNGLVRSYDMACAGQGRLGPVYIALEPASRDKGKLFIQAADVREENPRSVAVLGAVLSSERPKSRLLFRGLDQDIAALDFVLPNQSNLSVEECTLLSETGDVGVGCEISRYSVTTGKRDAVWRLPGPPPERYIANGDHLLTLYSPNMVFFWTGAPDNPARLRCYKAVPYLERAQDFVSIPKQTISSNTYTSGFSRDDTFVPIAESSADSQYLSNKPVFLACNSGESEMMWDINLSRDWSNASSSPREQFCVVRNIHMTSRHAVVLVHWYPTSSMHKLSGTSFRILDIDTGATVKTLAFSTRPEEIYQYSSYTTVSDHDFVVTDTHIVSGGPNGELYVWNYHNSSTPIYAIPPHDMHKSGSTATSKTVRTRRYSNSSSSNGRSGGSSISTPMYTTLSVSVDGKYLVAATNNRITVWNMFSKQLHGVYNNGRKVAKRDTYVRNPFDSFTTGVWILTRDWRTKRRRLATSLERLFSDDTYVDDNELVSEKFTFVTDPLGISDAACKQLLADDTCMILDDDEGSSPTSASSSSSTRRSTRYTPPPWLIRQSTILTEVWNMLETALFWAAWLFCAVWAYLVFIILGGALRRKNAATRRRRNSAAAAAALLGRNVDNNDDDK